MTTYNENNIKSLNELGIQCIMCPEDIEQYESQSYFFIAKFLSTVIVYPLFEFYPSIISLLLFINLIEAIITEYKGKTYKNMVLGIFVYIFYLILLDKSFLFMNDGLLLWLMIYHYWNLNFCRVYSDYKVGLVHNGIPFIYTILLSRKYTYLPLIIKWGQIRGASISIAIGIRYIDYLRTKQLMGK